MSCFVEFQWHPEDELERPTKSDVRTTHLPKAHEKQANSPREGESTFPAAGSQFCDFFAPFSRSSLVRLAAPLADYPGSAPAPEAYNPSTSDPSSTVPAPC